MANRAQQITRLPLAALGAAGFLAALNIGTLVVVALYADAPSLLSTADWVAIRFTITQALVSATLSSLLAIPVARALARRAFPGRGIILTILGVPFILPVIVAVLGLLAVLGRAGLMSQIVVPLGFAPLNIYGFTGVVLAHVFFNLPLATRLFLQGWQAIPAEHFRLAAQLGLKSGDIARHLERPMLIAVLPGAFTTIFLLCLTSFAVALTLGGGPKATTVELAIYQAFRFDFDLSRAALLALVQFTLCAVAAAVAWKIAEPAQFGKGLGETVRRWDSPGLGHMALDAVILVAVALFLLPPLGMIVLQGLGGVSSVEPAVWAAAIRSICVALGSVVLTLGLSIPLAQAIARLEPVKKGFAGALESAGYLSLAASPMVVGTGLFIVLFPLIDPTRAALPVTALVNAALSLPFALRILLPAIRDAEQDYGQLAQSLGMRGLTRFRLVTWPRIRPSAGFAAGLTAALSMGDLGVIALFANPDAATLPMVIYRLMGSYQMDAAHTAALLLVLLSFGLFWVFDQGGRLYASD